MKSAVMMLSCAYKEEYGNAALRNVWLFCFLLDSEYTEQKEVHPILGELLFVDWVLSGRNCCFRSLFTEHGIANTIVNKTITIFRYVVRN